MVQNACCEFDVETLRPTYRLLIGIPGKSNAFAISQRLGLDGEIIEEAKKFLRGEDIQFEELLSDIRKNRLETERELENALRKSREIEKLKNAITEQKRKIEEEKEAIINQARKEARAILAGARRQADEIMEKLKELEKAYLQRNIDREMMELRQNMRQKINELDAQLAETVLPRKGYAKPPENLKPGDTVVIINLNQKGTVLEPPDKDGNVQIQAGIMKIKMHITQLRQVDEQQEVTDGIRNTRVKSVKSGNVSLELDIRGYNIEEARERIDKYIDDAVIAGLHEVSIIHGKGTGTLRKRVHEFLSGHPHVKSFRLGKYGEGESGVTVVTLME